MILSLRVDLVKQSLTFRRYLRLPRSLERFAVLIVLCRTLALTEACNKMILLVIASDSEAISGDWVETTAQWHKLSIQKQYFVYIITNQWNNVFYTGVTNNLIKRLFQHKEKLANGFTKRYNVKKLVYYEIFNNINDVLVREKQIKSGSRQKKIELIKSMNYNWENLNKEICN